MLTGAVDAGFAAAFEAAGLSCADTAMGDTAMAAATMARVRAVRNIESSLNVVDDAGSPDTWQRARRS
jgi:hypothetical protein